MMTEPNRNQEARRQGRRWRGLGLGGMSVAHQASRNALAGRREGGYASVALESGENS